MVIRRVDRAAVDDAFPSLCRPTLLPCGTVPCDLDYFQNATTWVAKPDPPLARDVALRLGTDTPSGIVIAGWDFVLPWDCHIDWEYRACDVIPTQDQLAYEKLLKSRLTARLNERLLERGRPVEGLLCGRMFEPIPEPLARAETVSAEICVTDTTGYTKSLPVSLAVTRNAQPALNAGTGMRKGRLLDTRDKPVDESLVEAAEAK